MEVTINLTPENLDAIAERVVIIQNRNKSPDADKPIEEPQYTVNQIAELTKKSSNAIRHHIRINLLIASKVGKSWLISQTNYNKYINNEQ